MGYSKAFKLGQLVGNALKRETSAVTHQPAPKGIKVKGRDGAQVKPRVHVN